MNLHFSTAYHAQTNDQSEKSNQTVEIALCHLLPDFKFEEQWPKTLPQLQTIINNSQNTNFTKLNPNKIIYGFQIKESIDFLLHNEHEPDPIKTYQPLRTDAKDAIGFD